MYQKKLEQLIKAWNKESIEDEWMFENFRQTQVMTLDSCQAFSELEPTLKILYRQSDESTCIELVETLLCLARRSATTELPAAFDKAKLDSIFFAFGDYAQAKLNELYTYYRL